MTGCTERRTERKQQYESRKTSNIRHEYPRRGSRVAALRRTIAAWCTLGVTLACAGTAHAAVRTWTGGGADDNWSTVANWDTGVPMANDSVAFTGSTRLTPNNDLPANRTILGVTFSAAAGAFTLTGNAIDLGGNVTNNSTNLQTINLPLRLTANRTFTANSSGDITVGGVLSQSAAYSLTKLGTGALTLSAANTFTGGVTLRQGTLNIGNAAALGTGTLTIDGTCSLDNTSGAAITLSTNNSIALSGGSPTFVGTSDLNLGTGVITLSGANRTITVTNAAATLTVGGAIGDAGQVRGLTKSGVGTLILGGASTYTGATTVNAGTLRLGASNRIADASGLVLSGGTFSTGGFNETLGAFSLDGNSFLNFGAGANSTLRFTSVGTISGTTINAQVLEYNGADRLFIGTSGTSAAAALGGTKGDGVSNGNETRIKFLNPEGLSGTFNADQLSSGEVVPIITTASSPSALISEFRFHGLNSTLR